jgi:hypothetical protein
MHAAHGVGALRLTFEEGVGGFCALSRGGLRTTCGRIDKGGGGGFFKWMQLWVADWVAGLLGSKGCVGMGTSWRG